MSAPAFLSAVAALILSQAKHKGAQGPKFAGVSCCLCLVAEIPVQRRDAGIREQGVCLQCCNPSPPQCSLLGGGCRLHVCARSAARCSACGFLSARLGKSLCCKNLLEELLLFLQSHTDFGVSACLAVGAMGSALSPGYLSLLCSMLQVRRKEDATASW